MPDSYRPRVVTIGESMGLIHTDAIGSLVHLSELHLSIGGAESNVAIGLARLGVKTSWIGRVGDDSVGRRILRELRAEQVDLRAIVDPAAPTGLMLKEHPSAATTQVWYYRRDSAGSRLRPSDIEPDVIRSAELLHLTGITAALSPTARQTVDAAVGYAREAGTLVSFDVNHRSRLWDAEVGAPVYRELAAASDIVFAGLDEARIMLEAEVSVDEALDRLGALGPTQIVIKLGADGCAASIDGERFRLPAVPIAPVDTVGAGDAFVAGYLAEALLGATAADRLETAVRAGALACLVPGDWEGAPDRNALADLSAKEPVRR